MSKSFFNSMLPSYTQFQPFTSSQLTSVASLIHLNNNNNNYNINQNHNQHINTHHNNTQNNRVNLSLATSTSESGSLANSEDGISNSPSVSDSIAAYKMYPYVSNHPSSHTSLSGMPGFSGLEDKSCR